MKLHQCQGCQRQHWQPNIHFLVKKNSTVSTWCSALTVYFFDNKCSKFLLGYSERVYGVFFLYPAVTMSLDSNSYSLWQTLHSDCKTLPVMLTVACLLLSLDPTLPSLSIHSHTFPACSNLIGSDNLKAPQLDTSGWAVKYSADILSTACVCMCVFAVLCSNATNLSVTWSDQSLPAMFVCGYVCICVWMCSSDLTVKAQKMT